MHLKVIFLDQKGSNKKWHSWIKTKVDLFASQSGFFIYVVMKKTHKKWLLGMI